MANYKSCYAICPFYKDEPENKIICEGIISESCANIFRNATDKEKHLNRFCRGYKYINCPFAKYLLKIYKDEDVRKKEEARTQIYKNTQKKGFTQRERNKDLSNEQREIFFIEPRTNQEI